MKYSYFYKSDSESWEELFSIYSDGLMSSAQKARQDLLKTPISSLDKTYQCYKLSIEKVGKPIKVKKC